MTTIHHTGCKSAHTHETQKRGCGSINCRENNNSKYTEYGGGLWTAVAIFGGLTLASKVAGSVVANISSSKNVTSEDVQAEIDEIYDAYSITDEAQLSKNEKDASAELNKASDAVATISANLDTAKSELGALKITLREANSALRGISPDDPNYATLSANLATAKAKLEAKEAEINKLEGALKQAKADEAAKKAEHKQIESDLVRLSNLKVELERVKEREAKEAKNAEEAEAKRKRLEEIDHLSNGDTVAISKLLRQIKNAERMNLGQREDRLRVQLDAALEQYYKNHKVGDNKTIDSLPEAKAYQQVA